MPSFALDEMPHAPRTVRLKTLITLRWFAVIGQALTVFIVYYWLEFDLPIAPCLTVITLPEPVTPARAAQIGQARATGEAIRILAPGDWPTTAVTAAPQHGGP